MRPCLKEKGVQAPSPYPALVSQTVLQAQMCALLQVHAYIISYLKKEMPSVFGKENKKKQLILKLPVIFAKIQLEHNISPGDFPDCQKMQVGQLQHSGRLLMGEPPAGSEMEPGRLEGCMACPCMGEWRENP